jgi:hypothetical protein
LGDLLIFFQLWIAGEPVAKTSSLPEHKKFYPASLVSVALVSLSFCGVFLAGDLCSRN